LIFLVFQIGEEKTWSFSMPQKLNSSIFLLDTIFHTIMTSSSKTLNSNLHLSSIFSMFLFLLNFLGKKASKRLGVLRRLRGFLFHPSCLLFIRVLFEPLWCTPHTSGVVPHIQLFSKRWSLGLFVFSPFLLLPTLSNLFLPVELLRQSLNSIAITTDTALLNSHIAYLLH